MKRKLYVSSIIVAIILVVVCFYKVFAFRIMGGGEGTYISCDAEIVGDDDSRHTYCHWCTETTVYYCINQNGAGDGLTYNQTRTDVDSALTAWGNISTSYLNLSYSTYTANYNDPDDDKNVIFWAAAYSDPYYDWGYQFPAGTVAATIVTVDSENRLEDADVYFVDERDYTTTMQSGKKDVSGWLMHELGHTIGIHHSENSSAVMYQYYGGTYKKIANDDSSGVTWLYNTTSNWASIYAVDDEIPEDTWTYFYAVPNEGSPHATSYKWWYRQDPDDKEGGGTKAPPVGQWIYMDNFDDDPTIQAKGYYPSFQLAVVIDDVIRGTDSVSKTIYIEESKSGSAKGLMEPELQKMYVFNLLSNYPNPFNPVTNINYSLAEESRVTMTVYNLLGERLQTLVEESKPAGDFSVLWDGKDDYGMMLPAGVYIYRIQAVPMSGAAPFVETRKMVFSK